MKIQRSKNKNRKRILLLLAAITLLAAIGLFIYFNQPQDNNNSRSSKPQKESSKSDMPSNSDTAPQVEQQKKPPVASPDVDPSKTTNEIPASSSVSISITNLVQSGEKISYNADVVGTTNGKCSAIFTNKIGKPVTRVIETTSGKCSADISVSEFDALGDWTLQLTFYSNNTQSSDSKVITIK